MRLLRQLLCGAIAGVCALLAPRAEAVPLLQLSISDGINPAVVLTDVGSTGALMYAGGLGNWILNVTTGTGYPITGTTTQPLIDLNSINVASTAGGTLTMMLTEIGHVGADPAGLFAAAIGGTVSANPGTLLTYAAYTDSTNAAFGTQSLIGSGAFGPGAFAYSATASGLTGALYSITQIVQLTALPGATNTNLSFNGELRAVPEPASMVLLGAGLVGLVLTRRRVA